MRQLSFYFRHSIEMKLPIIVDQLKRCQEIILATSGQDELYELLKIILGKFLWEKTESKDVLCYRGLNEITLKNKDIFIDLISDDKIYLSEEITNECLRIISNTNIHDISDEILHLAFEIMTSRSFKSDKGQYFTPRHVIDFCTDLMDFKDGDTVCDIACGCGSFLRSSLLKNSNIQTFGFDISQRAIKVAKVINFLTCHNKTIYSHIDSLSLEPSDIYSNTVETFLKKTNPDFNGFDFILTNPPFAGDISNTKDFKYYELSKDNKNYERDVFFLERSYNLLKNNGKLLIILPENKISSKKYKPFREWIFSKFKIISIISLHGNTFKPFTSQKTSILILQKSSECNNEIYDIPLYKSEHSGKKSNGDFIIKNGEIFSDLKEISKHFKEFYIV